MERWSAIPRRCPRHRRTRRPRGPGALRQRRSICEPWRDPFASGERVMAQTLVPGAWVPDAPGRLRAMASTMRALRKTTREPGADLVEIAVPEPREGEVLVKVHGASICGTDLHIYDWNEWADKRIPQVPMTFGHEVAGTVVAV